MMNPKTRDNLNDSLQAKTFQCIAVIGDRDSCKNLVIEELDKLQLEYDHFVNVQSMSSLEEIHRHQLENTVIREGNKVRPTFIRSFLAANGFQQMPKILVLSEFNSVPSERTYFLKALLDERAHEEDECYNQLLSIILMMNPVDAHGVSTDVKYGNNLRRPPARNWVVFFKELQKRAFLSSLVGRFHRFFNRTNHPTKMSVPTYDGFDVDPDIRGCISVFVDARDCCAADVTCMA